MLLPAACVTAVAVGAVDGCCCRYCAYTRVRVRVGVRVRMDVGVGVDVRSHACV